MKVPKDALIITASELDEKIIKVKVCVDSPTLNSKESGDRLLYVILAAVYVKYHKIPQSFR